MAEPKITPLARRLAEENGIDWRKLQGTGPDGTIVERDILAFLAKLMAGEVDLPPAPEPPPPSAPRPEDLERAMSVLAKEGVHLEEVLPQAARPEELSDLNLESLIDVELDFEDVALEEEPEARASTSLSEEAEATHLTWPEDLPAEPFGLSAEEEAWALEEPAVLEEPEPPLPGWAKAEPQPEAGLEGIQPQPVPEARPEVLEGASVLPAPPSVLRVHRARLDLGPAQRAAEVLARALGGEEGAIPLPTYLEALLAKAAEKALAELGLPHPALLGRLEGETLRGAPLPPGGLRALAQAEWKEEEGLFCLYDQEELHTGKPVLYLHPEGLLALSGPFEPQEARALLEGVKRYLEEPLLLFL